MISRIGRSIASRSFAEISSRCGAVTHFPFDAATANCAGPYAGEILGATESASLSNTPLPSCLSLALGRVVCDRFELAVFDVFVVAGRKLGHRVDPLLLDLAQLQRERLAHRVLERLVADEREHRLERDRDTGEHALETEVLARRRATLEQLELLDRLHPRVRQRLQVVAREAARDEDLELARECNLRRLEQSRDDTFARSRTLLRLLRVRRRSGERVPLTNGESDAVSVETRLLGPTVDRVLADAVLLDGLVEALAFVELEDLRFELV
jgi:hypothetical protein